LPLRLVGADFAVVVVGDCRRLVGARAAQRLTK
jgi:hypothetical protein